MSRRVAIAVLVVLSACASRAPVSVPPPTPPPALIVFEATAYSIEGRTASGVRTREGIVAADPKVLPLGSRIRLHDAGQYSGTYLVADTGAEIKGRELDLYLANDGEAKRFGRRRVKVEILERGRAKR